MLADRLRILHAYKIYKPDIDGGIPAVISSLAHPESEAATHSILTARRFGRARRYRWDEVSVNAVSSLGTLFSTPLAPAFVPALIRHAKSSDIVIHHAPLPLNDAAIVLGLPRHVALVVYWHADIVGFPLLKRAVTPLIQRTLYRADRIVVSSQPMIEASEFLAPHQRKCAVLPYGMDLDEWHTLDTEDKAVTDRIRERHPRHIVTIGRLVDYKGYDILIRALQTVDAHLTIIGEGPLLTELTQFANRLGISERIEFVGRRSRREIKQLFHSAQVFAFPSTTEAEAFGIVQIEAMAAGLPVVNTDLPTTVPLVARQGLEALTVPPYDAAALSQALNRILGDTVLAERLGSNGQKRAFAEFGQAAFRTRMAQVYEAAITTRKRRLSETKRGGKD
jgi:rhamnosyl/mannosyltransferase